MIERVHIPTLNNEIPTVGIGTWGFGGWHEKETRTDEQDEADISAIEAAVLLGLRHIDTAEYYAQGYAEELVGKALQRLALKGVTREELFIASKAMGHHLTEDELARAVDRSLRRMRISYLDLYMVHHPNDEVPIEETMRAMEKLVADGRIRKIGVSNFALPRLIKAREALKHNELVANQVHYSLVVREPVANGVLEYCQQNGIAVVAWQPLRGVLGGSGQALLEQVAQRYVATPAQVALSWLLGQENVAVVAKAAKIEHWRDNLGAVGLTLAKEDAEMLRRDFPEQLEKSDVYPSR